MLVFQNFPVISRMSAAQTLAPSLSDNHTSKTGIRVNTNKVFKLLVVAVIVISSFWPLATLAQDRATVDTTMKILLENDCVRVQYHDVAVGQTVPMHSHPHYIVYALNSYKVRVIFKDGSQIISEHEAGTVHWNEATVHSIENIGSTDVHNLVIELKQGASCTVVSPHKK